MLVLLVGVYGSKLNQYAHTVVCTDAFEVLTFGDGASGRLGHGGENDEALPTMITTIY